MGLITFNNLGVKRFQCLLNQGGANPPVATILFNEISKSITLTYTFAGQYGITFDDVLIPSGKLIVNINNGLADGTGNVCAQRKSTGITITSVNFGGVLSDNIITNASLTAYLFT